MKTHKCYDSGRTRTGRCTFELLNQRLNKYWTSPDPLTISSSPGSKAVQPESGLDNNSPAQSKNNEHIVRLDYAEQTAWIQTPSPEQILNPGLDNPTCK